MSKYNPTTQQFIEAAAKWRKELLMLPVLGLEESTKYMTIRPGIRYAETVGQLDVDAQFAPYSASAKSAVQENIQWRELKTYFGSVVKEFEPNKYVSTILGEAMASKGDGIKSADIAKKILVSIAKSLGKNLNDVLFSAQRNASGTTSADLFDGFDTITDEEVTQGALATSYNNYEKMSVAISAANAYEKLRDIVRGLSPELRAQNTIMYCSQDIYDAYVDSYLLTHAATPYNDKFDKTFIEGSQNRVEIVPLVNKAGSKYIHITNKSNMLIGVDQMSDNENVLVEKYAPFVLSYVATMFFGCQFETLDPRVMKVIELA